MNDGGVRIDLSKQQLAELGFLVSYGYADSKSLVAKYLIKRGLDDLRRCRVIPPYCECGFAADDFLKARGKSR